MATTNNSATTEQNAKVALDASVAARPLGTEVTPNTTPAVKRTHVAKISDGDYAVSYEQKYKDASGREATATVFPSKSSIGADVVGVYRRLLNEGKTGITTWKKSGPKLYTEDTSFLPGEKLAKQGKAIDRNFADMLTTFSATLRQAASLVRSGEYSDEVQQELKEAWNQIENYRLR
jgi:hypothetical protein